MKKQIIFLFVLTIIALIGFTSCEPFIENKIIVQNLAAGDVQLNIRGQVYNVPSENKFILTDFKKGTFEYETIYHVTCRSNRF